MKSAVETLNPTRVKLTVEVPFDELKPSLDAAYKTIGSQVTVPGFRKGKVPPRIIDQRFGRGAVLEEAVNDALPQFYGQAVEENEVRPLGQPEVDVTEVPTRQGRRAEVHRRGRRPARARAARLLDGIEVTVDDAEVTDDDVDERLDDAARAVRHPHRRRPRRRRRATSSRIDLTATIDGEEIDSVKGVSYEVGSGDDARGPRRGRRRPEAGESTDFTAAARRRRPRRRGRRGHGHRAVGQGARAARARTTTSPSWPASSTPSRSCATTCASRPSRSSACEQGIQARDQAARGTCSRPSTSRCRRARRGRGALATSRARTGSRTTSTAPRSSESARKAFKTQFLLDAIVEKEQVSVNQQELIEYLVMSAAAVRHGRRTSSPRRSTRPAGAGDGRRGRPPQGARRGAREGEVTDAVRQRPVDLATLSPTARTPARSRRGRPASQRGGTLRRSRPTSATDPTRCHDAVADVEPDDARPDRPPPRPSTSARSTRGRAAAPVRAP